MPELDNKALNATELMQEIDKKQQLVIRNQRIEVNHPRTEQEEADRLVELVSSISMSSLSECKVIAQVFTSEKITALQLRGLSTEFEEKVLTILKGM